ncbi:MAG: hypothetical protein LUF30_05220, partial [Lachnospiraceae bacterium]|nr:hypothetical protein [Lachnospiraceae bacterium]
VLEVRYPAGYEEVASALDHLQDPYADTWLLFVAAEDETEMDINAADALLWLETDADGNLHAQIEY